MTITALIVINNYFSGDTVWKTRKEGNFSSLFTYLSFVFCCFYCCFFWRGGRRWRYFAYLVSFIVQISTLRQVIGVKEQKDRHIDATHPKNIKTYINVRISFMVTPMTSWLMWKVVSVWGALSVDAFCLIHLNDRPSDSATIHETSVCFFVFIVRFLFPLLFFLYLFAPGTISFLVFVDSLFSLNILFLSEETLFISISKECFYCQTFYFCTNNYRILFRSHTRSSFYFRNLSNFTDKLFPEIR